MNIKNRKELHYLINDHKCKIGCELGVAKGRYSKYLVENCNFDQFFCIDSWDSRGHNTEEYKLACNNLKQFKNINIVRTDFLNALSMFEDNFFDFIYVDGYAHTGNNFIFEWYSKLKNNGIYAGHDYHIFFEKNIHNVNTLCTKYNKQVNLTGEECNNNINKNIRPSVLPSWWFIK